MVVKAFSGLVMFAGFVGWLGRVINPPRPAPEPGDWVVIYNRRRYNGKMQVTGRNPAFRKVQKVEGKAVYLVPSHPDDEEVVRAYGPEEYRLLLRDGS